MYKPILCALLMGITLTSCSKDKTYTITTNRVGQLTKETMVNDIKTVFENDSIVGLDSEGIKSQVSTLEIYKKGGGHLLSLTPRKAGDSAHIQTIQIYDPQYVTEKGISIASTFKDIQEAYTITKIETLLSSVVVFVDDINAYFTIDKIELPSSLQNDFTTKVHISQVPDNAKIKYFMIGWD